MRDRIKVDVSTSSPILFMEVDVDDFGRLFAGMAADQQVAVFAAMVEHMRPHPIQWDYISIELEMPENQDLCRSLLRIFEESVK